jgi:hypothetical protein
VKEKEEEETRKRNGENTKQDCVVAMAISISSQPLANNNNNNKALMMFLISKTIDESAMANESMCTLIWGVDAGIGNIRHFPCSREVDVCCGKSVI